MSNSQNSAPLRRSSRLLKRDRVSDAKAGNEDNTEQDAKYKADEVSASTPSTSSSNKTPVVPFRGVKRRRVESKDPSVTNTSIVTISSDNTSTAQASE